VSADHAGRQTEPSRESLAFSQVSEWAWTIDGTDAFSQGTEDVPVIYWLTCLDVGFSFRQKKI
jgi:hypothetical protein